MKIIKDDIARYKKSPLRVIKHSFYFVLALLVAWQFIDPTPTPSVKVEQSASAKVEQVEKHWSEYEKKQVYDALNRFCSSQNYRCLSGSYVTFSKNGYVSPVVRVQYPITWYATKDIRAVSQHNARAVNNYLKFNTGVTQVKYTIIKVVGIDGKETRYGI